MLTAIQIKRILENQQKENHMKYGINTKMVISVRNAIIN